MSMPESNANTSLARTIVSPTDTIDALVTKLSVSLLLLASAILFYTMSNRNTSKIPKTISVALSIALMLLSCIISIFATYEFDRIIPKYSLYCNKNNCLYDTSVLHVTRMFYTSFSIVFICVNISICYIIFKYHK
jgi:hypothetical protein